jgi:hypothetical protein
VIRKPQLKRLFKRGILYGLVGQSSDQYDRQGKTFLGISRFSHLWQLGLEGEMVEKNGKNGKNYRKKGTFYKDGKKECLKRKVFHEQ